MVVSILANQPNGPIFVRLAVAKDDGLGGFETTPWSNVLTDTVSQLAASTLDPVAGVGRYQFISLSNGDLTARNDLVNVGAIAGARTTNSRTGKFYFEADLSENASAGWGIGVCTSAQDMSDFNLDGTPAQRALWRDNGSLTRPNNTSQNYGGQWALNELRHIAWDEATGLMWVGTDGTWHNGDPVAGTGGDAIPAGALHAFVALTPRNTGQTTLTLDPSADTHLPTGFTVFT